MITWDIYDITAGGASLHGVSLQGRLRKLALQIDMDLLVEHAFDLTNHVRFAVVAGTDVTPIEEYLNDTMPHLRVKRVARDVANPVLTKMHINNEDYYNL